jgi:uncharacterized membrane protein
LVLPLQDAIVLGFDLAAFVFLLSATPLWRSGTPSEILDNAARDDAGRALRLGVSGIVLIVILVALGLMIEGRPKLGPGDLGLVVATLVLSWVFANLVYAFHYAHLYYDQANANVYYDQVNANADHGGLRFPDTQYPEFSDFCYFSFGLGMTFQVSDVSITAPRLRRVATIHAILAFFFNLGVLALSVNVLAGVL